MTRAASPNTPLVFSPQSLYTRQNRPCPDKNYKTLTDCSACNNQQLDLCTPFAYQGISLEEISKVISKVISLDLKTGTIILEEVAGCLTVTVDRKGAPGTISIRTPPPCTLPLSPLEQEAGMVFQTEVHHSPRSGHLNKPFFLHQHLSHKFCFCCGRPLNLWLGYMTFFPGQENQIKL